MSGLYSPDLMFEHCTNAKKGWFDMSSLDIAAPGSANVTFPIPRGRVVHLNSVGQFEMGLSGTEMGVFLLNGSYDYDVNNPGTTRGGNFVQQAVMPSGNLSGLVATGGYELYTTEYDPSRTYTPGDLLTAVANNTSSAVGGLLTNAGTGSHGNVKQYVDAACGVVSTGLGPHPNQNSMSVLSLWPIYLPGAYV